ncbi:MATE family efflux transporter [Phenylobacterium sp.]|uniref:MATE family efflux transporter n=1 Tax=Phenylobacterium sp. TaxID=1871053 RepID=UPI0025F251B5|nr:MATE family efflux transporter [Phenylobacterium sp.]
MPDLTTGPIGKTLILFALPVMGSNILQSLNGTANAVWVSHVLGEAALTAISNSNQIFFLMLGAMFGMSMAANIMIGQAVGAGDRDLARRVVGTATLFFLALSTVVGALGYTLTPAILTGMATPPDAKRDAIAYLRVIFTAIPILYAFTFLMMAQRGAGDSRTPFFFSLVAVGLEVTLNPLLIMGVGPFPRLDIVGSATATLIAQSTTLAVMVTHLYRRRSILVLTPAEWRSFRPDWDVVKNLVFKGLPMAFQMIVISLAAVTMMSLVNGYGSTTAAAYGAAVQVWTYVQMPAMALGAAVSSMAAQNVGAGNMERVGKIARVGVMYAAIFSATPIVIIYLLDPIILQAFLPAGSPSLPIAVHINSIVLWGFIPFGMAFIFSGIVRATGAVWPPLLAMIIALWGVRVPLANALEPMLGADAVWLSFPAGSLVSLLLAAAYYRWGGWRKSRMLPTTPHGETLDTGMAPPSGVEETEVAAEAAARAPEKETEKAR